VSEAQRRKKDAKKIVHVYKKAKDAKKIVHVYKKAGRLHKAYMTAVVSFFALYLMCYFGTGTLPTESY
jgi:hypothetical protein